jgi:hypothetical protein
LFRENAEKSSWKRSPRLELASLRMNASLREKVNEIFAMSNRVWKIVLSLTTALGVFIGYRLSRIPNLQPYKLLNIVGLLYSLLAIFVLSEVLVASAKWKRICVEWIAPVLLWAHITVPIHHMTRLELACQLGLRCCPMSDRKDAV